MKRTGLTILLLALMLALGPLSAAATSAAAPPAQGGPIQIQEVSGDESMKGEVVPALPIGPLGMTLPTETEPNDTAATANALGGSQAVVLGNVTPGGDYDYFSFTANAGDRVYAAVMTQFSNVSGDSRLDVMASDGTTSLEFDDDNGSFSGLSSAIGGTVIPASGTYYVRVYGYSATTVITPYHLHVRVQSGTPTAEIEPNNDLGTANPLPAAGWVSGTITATTDPDLFSFGLNAGDSVYLGLDMDPDRNPANTNWNGRVGLGVFDGYLLVANDGGTTKPHAEALFMTVQETGTYYAYVDSTSATGLGANARYYLSVSIYPKQVQSNCTTFTSTDVPKTIGPATGTVTSTILVPGTVTSAIEDLNATIVLTHNLMQDLDVTLLGPTGVSTPLFTDVGSSTAGTLTNMDIGLDDQAALAIGPFTVLKDIIWMPEQPGRLSAFSGTPAGGTWTLQIADDLTNTNGGTLQGWSLEVCGAPPAAYAVELNKTVGTEPAVCATTDSIIVPPGTTVYYCYTARNTGLNTLATHDLVDSQLGTIFTGVAYSLAPGATYSHIQSATVNATVTNTGTWTAYGVTGGTASDSDTATVNVPFACPAGYDAVTVDATYFDNPFPPAGWTLSNTSSGCTAPGLPDWTNTNPGLRSNLTGGAGLFAIADSDRCGSGSTIDAIMSTGLLDFTGLISPTVYFNTDYYDIGTGGDQAQLDVSTDGGATWGNVLTWDASQRGPLSVAQAIPGAGENDVMARWHYVQGTYDWWWQVDNGFIMACEAPPQPPNIDVTPLSLASTQQTNTTTQQTLTIGNTGGDDLTWVIAEEPDSVLVPGGNGGSGPAAPAAGATGSRGGTPDATAPIVYDSPASFSEDFPDITLLPGQGWFFQNNSNPLGLTDWFQGNDTVFPAHAGATTSYIGANFNNTAGVGNISNWMLTPEVNLTDGDTISFWTRTATGSSWADRLQVRLSTAGASTNVGADDTSVGDFTTLLLDINPTLVGNGYPQEWTQYSITLSGIPAGATGRIGFRYYVTNGGPSGANSNYIGIDTLEYTSAGPAAPCDAPADVPWLSEVPTGGTTAGGASTPVQVTFDSTALAAGTYTARLCIDSNDPDAGPGNGTARVIVPVQMTVETLNPLADLSLVKTDTPDPVTVGNLLTYTVVVTNNGPDAAANVLFTDTLPADFTFVNGTISTGACVVSSGVITCSAASLASAGTITGVFWGTVDAVTCPGTLSNTAIVTSDVDDPTPANNTDTEDTAYVCAGAPVIVVAPAALALTVPQGYTAAVLQTLTISNTGTADLDWALYEQATFSPAAKTGGPAANPGISVSAATGAALPAAPPASPEDILWDQPLSTVNTNAYVNQAFPDFPTYSSYLADDFVNAVPWSITNIFVPGGLWNGATTLLSATNFTWVIYADNAGVPAGDPSGAGAPPVWSLSLLPTDTQVVITNGSGGTPSDVLVNLTTPANLPPGHYWLIFYPTMEFGTVGQYGRQPAETTNGYTVQFVNPGGGFGYGTAWQSWAVLGPTETDMAFRIEGTTGSAGCTPTDIPWLSANPLAGTTAPGAASPVDVTYSNMSALAIGTYTGDLCIESNDPMNPTVLVPVTLTIRAPTAVDMTALAARTAVPLGLLAPVAGVLLALAAFVIVRRRRA